MTKKDESGGKRKVETSIVIEAPVEAVWKALTDARELKRWFPLDARVAPGEGGSIWISWGPPWSDESRIEIWEPNRRLRTVSGWFGSAEARSAPAEAVRLALDYVLEGRGGTTTLRLVHSGFGEGAEWDDEYDGVTRGWRFELRSLRHYLERHAGEDRLVAWARCRLPLAAPEIWPRLMSPGCLLAEGTIEGLGEGKSYAIRFVSGDELHGKVVVNAPPTDFAGTVENAGDALFRVGIERFGEATEVWLWLSAFGVAASEVKAIGDRWRALLAKVFPEGEVVRPAETPSAG